MFHNATKPSLHCNIIVNAEDTVTAIRQQMSELVGVHSFGFVMALINDNDIKKLINRNHSYDMIKKSKPRIFAMEINPEAFENARDPVAF
jgi:hypothetical protein